MILHRTTSEVSEAQPSFTQGVMWMSAYFLLILAIYISGIKPIGISADLRNYELLYNASAISDWASVLQGSDAGYFAMAKLAATAGWSFDLFAFVLAAGTCILLFLTVMRVDTNRVVLIAIYASYLFWLHEYTQIRVAAAIAIGLFAVYTARPAVRWPLFVLAVLIHNSFIVAVAAYAVVNTKRIDWIVALGVAGVLVFLSPLSESLIQRVSSYQDLASSTGQFTQINLFSLMPLVQLVGIAFAALQFKQLPPDGKKETFFSIIGVSSFYILSPLPVLAFRVFELFMPFFVILLSRLWGRSVLIRGLILVWILLGMRSAFFTADSTVIL